MKTIMQVLAEEFPDFDFHDVRVDEGNITLTVLQANRTMTMRFRDPRPHYRTDEEALAELRENFNRAVNWSTPDAPPRTSPKRRISPSPSF